MKHPWTHYLGPDYVLPVLTLSMAIVCGLLVATYIRDARNDRPEVTHTPNEFEARDAARQCLARGWTYQITVRYDLTAGESSAPTDFTIACRRFDP